MTQAIGMPASATLDTPVQRVFHQVSEKSPDLMKTLRGIFERILAPLYGSQEDALKKIALAQDRVCFLLFEKTDPVGVIAFKTIPSDEFASKGVRNSIEIKSLFVVDSENNSGQGFGGTLLNKVFEEALKLKPNPTSFHVTVSETKTDSFIFFSKRGFSVVDRWKGKYQPGKTEFLLHFSTAEKADALFQKAIRLFKDDEKEAFGTDPIKFSPQLVARVPKAHWDDIHALKHLSDGTFISCSKDNCLYKWNGKGELTEKVHEVEPTQADETAWITTLAVYNDEYWLSGERSGRVSLWTTKGNYVKDIMPKLPKTGHFSQKQNARRINCLAAGLDPQKPSFFVGMPTIFDEYNLIEGRTVSSTMVHKNDWVYCIHPLDTTRNLIAVGGVLEAWKKSEQGWRRDQVLAPEAPRTKETRCHISSLIPLESSPHQFALGAFGGGLTVVDASQGKILSKWPGHTGNIWALEKISPTLFASSGDDGIIHFWDTRSYKELYSLKEKNSVGIGALLRFNDYTLIAGTAPGLPLGDSKGAELLFYDLRK